MQFDAALSDLEALSITPNPPEKLLFRQSQAFYHLQRFHDCCEVLKRLRMHYPDNVAATVEFSRAIKRLDEQLTGRYNFKKLYTEAVQSQPPHLDHATYIGPVSIKDSGIGGRGLFTTKAIKAGDLLLCEKAFAHAFVDDTHENPESGQDVTLLVNVATDRITMGAQGDLIQMIVQKMYRNPSLASTITALHHGAYKWDGISMVDDTPVVDT